MARSGKALPRAYFITDPKRTPDPVRIAAQLPAGFGVIYRHFGAVDRVETARALARVCRRRRLVLLIAADPELALAVGADGVHWPQARLRGLRVRREGWIETASAHGPADIARAARLGVDAALLSPVFASNSPSAGAALGVMRLARLAGEAALPVIALGGVKARNAGRAMARGRAAGWAAIEAVLESWG